MARLLQIIGYILFGLVAAIAALAMMDNRTPVALHFLGYSTSEVSLYWWLVAAFVFGFGAGWLVGAVGTMRAKLGARRSRRELSARELEIDRLKDINAPPS